MNQLNLIKIKGNVQRGFLCLIVSEKNFVYFSFLCGYFFRELLWGQITKVI